VLVLVLALTQALVVKVLPLLAMSFCQSHDSVLSLR
jgi:hypothetical protein